MCGFYGQIGDLPFSYVINSESEIAHRGPDQAARIKFGEGTFSFFRLAINGLQNGMQPFVDEKNQLLTVVNGEIYNHLELRSELENLGARFRTNSDAEAVHLGYIFWGSDVFKKLEGMFSVGIYEASKGSVTLARDRLGKKPLYFRRQGQNVSFSSELGALPLETSEINRRLLVEYFLGDAMSWESSNESEIRSVPPASWTCISGGEEQTVRYWNLEEAIHKQQLSIKKNRDWLEAYHLSLRSSVGERLMSEVPCGVFLSGGMDSQIVTAMASRLGKIEKAYTLEFKNHSFDESRAAAHFADEMGIKHDKVVASLDSLAEMWALHKNTIDEPVADPAILAQMLLARAAQDETKVVLTGDGGDETLLGYQHVLAHSLVQSQIVKTLLSFGVRLLQPFLQTNRDAYFTPSFIAERFLRGADEQDLVVRDFSWRGSFESASILELIPGLREAEVENFFEFRTRSMQRLSNSDAWQDQWSVLYLTNYLPLVILRKVDRATMRFGVEARNPLLDRKVVEVALAMPSRFRKTLTTPKAPLVYSFEKTLGYRPKKIKKHGMGIPLASLLTGPLSQDLASLRDDDFFYEHEILNRDKVVTLLRDFEKNPVIRARQVWSLIVFHAWWNRIGRKMKFSAGESL